MKRVRLIAALEANGCRSIRNKGDHEVYGCPCGQHQTPVPRHRKVAPGTVNSIEKQIACLPKGWLQ